MFKKVLFAATVILFYGSTAFAQIETVRTVRANYPTPLADRHGAFLIDVACATGFDLLRKDWGTHVRLADGTGVSQDILLERNDSGRHYDILGDGEGAAVPGFELVVYEHDEPGHPAHSPRLVDPNRRYRPTCTPVEPPPPPPAPPIPGPTPIADYATVLEQLVKLSELVEALRAANDDLRALVQGVINRPVLFPTYRTRLFGQPVTLTPDPVR